MKSFKYISLFLLLLLAWAGFALWLCGGLDGSLGLALLRILLPSPFLGFAIQTAVLFLTRQGPKWLRLAPLGLLAVPVAMALNVPPKGFLWPLEMYLWLLEAFLYLLGWAAAWGFSSSAERGKGQQKGL